MRARRVGVTCAPSGGGWTVVGKASVASGLPTPTIARNTPIRRTDTDEEVGTIIAHLCTDATSWITGQSINVDGGGIMEH